MECLTYLNEFIKNFSTEWAPHVCRQPLLQFIQSLDADPDSYTTLPPLLLQGRDIVVLKCVIRLIMEKIIQGSAEARTVQEELSPSRALVYQEHERFLEFQLGDDTWIDKHVINERLSTVSQAICLRSGEKHIVVLKGVNHMSNKQTQHQLRRLLERTPSLWIIMSCTSTDAIDTNVLSRCMILNAQPVPGFIKPFVQQSAQQSESAEFIYQRAGNDIVTACILLESATATATAQYTDFVGEAVSTWLTGSTSERLTRMRDLITALLKSGAPFTMVAMHTIKWFESHAPCRIDRVLQYAADASHALAQMHRVYACYELFFLQVHELTAQQAV